MDDNEDDILLNILNQTREEITKINKLLAYDEYIKLHISNTLEYDYDTIVNTSKEFMSFHDFVESVYGDLIKSPTFMSLVGNIDFFKKRYFLYVTNLLIHSKSKVDLNKIEIDIYTDYIEHVKNSKNTNIYNILKKHKYIESIKYKEDSKYTLHVASMYEKLIEHFSMKLSFTYSYYLYNFSLHSGRMIDYESFKSLFENFMKDKILYQPNKFIPHNMKQYDFIQSDRDFFLKENYIEYLKNYGRDIKNSLSMFVSTKDKDYDYIYSFFSSRR